MLDYFKSGESVWKEFSNKLDGQYIDIHRWTPAIIKFQHKDHELTFDIPSVGGGYEAYTTVTRLRLPFQRLKELKMKLYKETVKSSIGKVFGLQDIIVGDKQLDKEFIIQSNNKKLIKEVLASEPLVEKLILFPKGLVVEIKYEPDRFDDAMHAHVEQNWPEGVEVLQLTLGGFVKNPEVLENMYHVACRLLNVLLVCNVAKENGTSFRFPE